MSNYMPQESEAARDQLREQIRNNVQQAQEAAAKAAADAEAAASGGQVVVIPGPPRPPFQPGTTVQINPENMIPPQAETISIAFFVMVAAVIIGYPLMRAFARRIERGTPVAAPIPAEVRDQLQQISQSVDAIAIEVERISEGQRFAAKLLSDRAREGSEVSRGQS